MAARGCAGSTSPPILPLRLQAARDEARGAFGNDAVLIEKYVETPRHIEVQVFGDGTDARCICYERDCSLQRRHQKVIEEAPAPGMTDAMREAMGDAAVRAARRLAITGRARSNLSSMPATGCARIGSGSWK